MKSWYVIQTKHKKEFLAESNLTNQDYTTYLPKIYETIHYRKTIKKVLKPLFSNYLFVLVDNLKNNWSKINYTRGVKGIVDFDGSFPFVPEEFIDALKSKEINGHISLSKVSSLYRGKICRINNSAFFNHICSVEKIYKNNKVVVLLNSLENKIKYLVSKEDIVPSL